MYVKALMSEHAETALTIFAMAKQAGSQDESIGRRIARASHEELARVIEGLNEIIGA